ncbi:MAG: efflux transporter periplasmic adaptor subunit [Nitrospira sp. HN-bin3]|jgi:membrane fusion protein (multidrug efflux system)|uniref:efflux RND transporter periplasmic adaptor subunit n=1 Tax=Nitrospira cf. moscoviensis SBR1015 TaxID=96242 RepID=UPI000A0E1F47|nr:efflux RND transporter periplasmic adaptor subunit [Nitrospira cf. moscoviensis SBR1015]OQW47407.1 MAG: efflux transporter periplasmic adaptor subunit [Nitrospira sp. HN-bin3]
MTPKNWIGSIVLVLFVILLGIGLASWKYGSLQTEQAASANQPEPSEAVTVAVARTIDHRPHTTSIGTVLALRSISLKNELAGTVREVRLTPGRIVEAGTLLVALDVSVEEADLRAQEAQVALAKTILNRRQNLSQELATTQEEVDRARADLDVAQAQIARTKAIIAKKTIRAPFRAKVGIADVHPGQYLDEGTLLTTLQGVADAVHVDFAVPQQVAGGLQVGETVEVMNAGHAQPITAKITAIDARVDPTTRNAMVRARIEGSTTVPAPGASVRVRIPVGSMRKVVAIPVNALRKGPGGDQVFVVAQGPDGQTRVRARHVESGPMSGDEIIIYEGLMADEQVAAVGSFKLRDGALVVIAQVPERSSTGTSH